MEQQARTRPDSMYLAIVILLMFVLPLSSIGMEFFSDNSSLPIMDLVGKWFLFWAVGVRLFTAGIRQAINPAFTAKAIFHLTAQESFVVIRELGFANICLGLMAILSFYVPPARFVAACAGGLFFGLASIGHIVKKPVSSNEWIAMISDLFVTAVMLAFILFCLR